MSQDEIDRLFDEWFAIRHKRLTKKDRENPAFRNLSRLAFEFGILLGETNAAREKCRGIAKTT